jgi:PAS domain S-box-containing protein
MIAIRRYYKALSLRAKLFLGTSIGTMLIVAVVGVSLFWVIRESINRDIKNLLSNSTASILSLVRTSVNTSIRNHLRAIALVLLLFVMSWWVARTATRPLPSLLLALKEGAEGNLSLRLDEGIGSEFGQLSAFYNHFIDNLEMAQSRLSQSEEKYRTIFEQAIEGMFQLLPDGKLVNINPAMAHIFGYSTPEEMLSEVSYVTEHLYVDPNDRKKLYEELFKKGKVVGSPIRLYRRDGSIFWAEVSERAVTDQQGTPVLVEGILKDATAQQELLESLATARKDAETASQLKSDFLAMISHEMRTPLTSMIGFAKIVKKQLQNKMGQALGTHQEDVAKYVQRAVDNLNIMETESLRLAKLIDNMMDFSRLEAGDMVLCVKPVNPANLIAQAIEHVSRAAEIKGLSCETSIDKNLPAVAADHDRILQVLIHLLSNAIKFTSAGGVVLSVVQQNHEVCFSVKDTGGGISSESLPRVFDHLTQLGDVETDKPQGAGLGLALCRSIVSLHGGRIWVESKLDEGSTFCFCLPVADEGSDM